MPSTCTIYLAGGCFWGVEELFRQIPGVVSTQTGYANGTLSEGVTYERVCAGDTGFRETVRVGFDPQAVSAERLLWAYYQVVDPSVENRQGADVGTQYQAGIYWEPADEALAQTVARVSAAERARVEEGGRPFCVELAPLSSFFAAEDYHQLYLVKNPGGYCHVSRAEMATVLAALR